MINLFLKAKHWQLFVLSTGIPIMIYFVMMGYFFSNITVYPPNSAMPDIDAVFGMMYLMPILMILLMGILFGWYWSIGVGLQSKIPEHLRLNVNLFKTFLLIPAIYIVGLAIFMSTMVRGAFFIAAVVNIGMIGFFMLVHLFNMFCIFYCMYFVAKTYKIAELQRPVTFSDYIGEFFLVWFYPVGVWILQPEINRMAETEDYPEDEMVDMV